MDHCLKERAFLRVHTGEGTAAERTHLRLCADCAERYEQLVEDLEAINLVLSSAPPVFARARRSWWPRQAELLAAATACTLLIAVALGVTWLRQPSRSQIALRPNTEAFASDLSDALFASDGSGIVRVSAEAPYLEAALDAGQPCSGDRFLAGECNDALSAYLIEDD